jgi:hypothetical protein
MLNYCLLFVLLERFSVERPCNMARAPTQASGRKYIHGCRQMQDRIAVVVLQSLYHVLTALSQYPPPAHRRPAVLDVVSMLTRLPEHDKATRMAGQRIWVIENRLR